MPKPPKPYWPADQVERRKLAELVPYERNARLHGDRQIELIERAIEAYGFTVPLLVDERDGIVAGHARYEAARRLGLLEVPVVVAKGWSDEKRRAYILLDNKLASLSTWDDGLLALELGELKDAGVDLGLVGFDASELTSLLGDDGQPRTVEFQAFDESIPTEHKCPKCGYVWSGKSG